MLFFYFLDAERTTRSAFVKHFPLEYSEWVVGTGAVRASGLLASERGSNGVMILNY